MAVVAVGSFIILSRPETFKLFRSVLGEWVASADGAATYAGTVLAALLFFLVISFLSPVVSYLDTPAPSVAPGVAPVVAAPGQVPRAAPAAQISALGTPCLGAAEAVALGGNCGCDADCNGHVSQGNYCSHKYKKCRSPMM